YRLTNVGTSGAGTRIGRSQRMADLMQDGRGEVAIHRRHLRLVVTHQELGDGQHNVIHARVHEVLKEDLLRSLLLVNARVVGQIVGHSLVTVTQIAGSEGS